MKRIALCARTCTYQLWCIACLWRDGHNDHKNWSRARAVSNLSSGLSLQQEDTLSFAFKLIQDSFI